MAIELVTKEDLQYFRVQLLNDIKDILKDYKPEQVLHPEGLKTKHVRQLLGCCYNTLQSLRISGKLRWKKIGGTVYYHNEDVQKLVKDGFQ